MPTSDEAGRTALVGLTKVARFAAGSETEPDSEDGRPHAMPAEFNILVDFAADCKIVDGINPDKPRALCDGVTTVPISIDGLAAGAQPDNDKPRATLAGLMRLEPGSEARLEAACCGEARLEVDCARTTGSNAANDATFSLAEHVCNKAGPAEFVRAMSSGSSGRDCIPLTSGGPALAAVSQKWGLLNAL